MNVQYKDIQHKKLFHLSLMLLFAAGISVPAKANYNIHRTHGIKPGTAPVVGLTYTMDNNFYTADKLKDSKGNEVNADIDVKMFYNTHKFSWMSSNRILGASWGLSLMIPVVYVDYEYNSESGSESSGRFVSRNSIMPLQDVNMFDGMTVAPKFDKLYFGDIALTPVNFSWNTDQYDVQAAFKIVVPTGHFDKDNFISAGSGMWTFIPSVGGTFYFDEAKSWSASVSVRYNIHTEKKDLNLRKGDDLGFEWSVAKSFNNILELGAVGSCQWQITDDSGRVGIVDKGARVYAAGPEVSGTISQINLTFSLRSLWEFGAVNHTQGNMTSLSIKKVF